MNIYIFSEINYNDNKHINQYLFDYLSNDNDIQCYFIERVTMRLPKLPHILNFLLQIKQRKQNKIKNEPKNKKIVATKIYPPFKIFEKINKYKISKIIGKTKNNIIISFVPHEHLMIENCSQFIYYCVHDSYQQGFSSKIIKFEQSLTHNEKNIVFCDNKNVLNRLHNNFNEYPNYLDNSNAYLMPPPVPDSFFTAATMSVEKHYDFCYYGSFHKDIDIDAILLLAKTKSILIISNNSPSILSNNRRITIHPPIYDMPILAKKILTAKNILLPYKNSEFMNTITPAKALQVQALRLPVYCTNILLAKKYNFSDNLEDLTKTKYQPIDFSFSVSSVCDFILNRIRKNI